MVFENIGQARNAGERAGKRLSDERVAFGEGFAAAFVGEAGREPTVAEVERAWQEELAQDADE